MDGHDDFQNLNFCTHLQVYEYSTGGLHDYYDILSVLSIKKKKKYYSYSVDSKAVYLYCFFSWLDGVNYAIIISRSFFFFFWHKETLMVFALKISRQPSFSLVSPTSPPP